MTLTVGTDAYDSLANVRAYWAARGDTVWAGLADADAEVYIRKGTDYIDRNWDYIGDQATAAQRLKWPRANAVVEGYTLSDTEIPWQVEEATAIAAELIRTSVDLDGVVTNDSASISMKKVDVITIQYDSNRRLNGASIPSHLYKLLRPLTRSVHGTLLRA